MKKIDPEAMKQIAQSVLEWVVNGCNDFRAPMREMKQQSPEAVSL